MIQLLNMSILCIPLFSSDFEVPSFSSVIVNYVNHAWNCVSALLGHDSGILLH